MTAGTKFIVYSRRAPGDAEIAVDHIHAAGFEALVHINPGMTLIEAADR